MKAQMALLICSAAVTSFVCSDAMAQQTSQADAGTRTQATHCLKTRL
jgi:hypothetical protein